MQQLTGLDASFLALEEAPGVYGHVGSVIVVDPSTSPEPFDLDHLRRLIASRLHLIPPFRRRLVEVPLGIDQPYWIEDPDFDIEYHVRELALPPPGDHAQLARQAARLHARHLDRRRPLWELYLIHGLQDGRLAIPGNQRARRGHQQPRQADQAGRVRAHELDPLAHPRAALRRQTRLVQARHHHPVTPVNFRRAGNRPEALRDLYRLDDPPALGSAA